MKSIKQAGFLHKIFALFLSLLYLFWARALFSFFTPAADNFSGLLQKNFSLGFLVILASLSLLVLCAWLYLFQIKEMALFFALALASSLIPPSLGLFKDLHFYGTLAALSFYLYPFFTGFWHSISFRQSRKDKDQESLFEKMKNLSYLGQVCFGVIVLAAISLWLFLAGGMITSRIQFFFVGGNALWLSLLSFESYSLCM